MARDPVHRFYGTQQWRRARETYLRSVGGLCERCLKKGLIVPAAHVHHIKRLTASTVDDPEITTGFNNLMALCERCHEEEHQKFTHGGRYVVDEDGNVNIL